MAWTELGQEWPQPNRPPRSPCPSLPLPLLSLTSRAGTSGRAAQVVHAERGTSEVERDLQRKREHGGGVGGGVTGLAHRRRGRRRVERARAHL